jgi:flagellar motor protein MotB
MKTNDVNFKIQEQKTDNSESRFDLDFLIAQNLVVSGNLDEAEHLLRKGGEQSLSIEALDLLARIAAQRGNFEQAGELWKTVLEKDPDNEAAKAAIKRLDSPWIAVALIKRLAFLASIAVVFFLSIVGLFALFNVDWKSQLKSSSPANISTPIGSTLSSSSFPGFSVHTNQEGTKIIFNEGLFSLRCDLKNSAKEQLATVAHLLQNKVPNSRIIIEGHTDSSSMRKNNFYKDNYDLGLQRALTIAGILKEHHQIKGERILVMSMGDTNPPFSETDYESKLKNRTVVIRLFEPSVR